MFLKQISSIQPYTVRRCWLGQASQLEYHRSARACARARALVWRARNSRSRGMPTSKQPTTAASTLPYSPYTPALVDRAFSGMPTGLRYDSLVRAFKRVCKQQAASAETATRRGGVRSTLFLIGVDGKVLHTASVMSPAESMTAAGRAAWRRQRRLAWYLWHASRHRFSGKGRVLLLAELDDVSDGVVSDGVRSLPKFSSSSGACGLKIAVPILLKGFGTTDLERWMTSHRASAQLQRHATPPWSQRIAMGVWRGSSRTVLPSETCSAVPDFTNWEAHPRGRLVSLAQRHPSLIDAGYTELEKLPGGNSTPVPLRATLRWDDLRRYKYQIEVDGHGYQASLMAKMLVGSVAITQQSHWRLWFQDALVSGRDVIQVRSDLRDLPEKIAWLRENDEQAQSIAARGRRTVHALLKPENLIGHVARLLARYKTLFAEPGLFVDSPPSLDGLFASLCSDGSRKCSVYNASSPPPRFANLAEHRHSKEQRTSTAVERIRCPTAHFSDSRVLRCDKWCRRSSMREHCTWCKCGGGDFCGGRAGSSQIAVPSGFNVA